VRAAWLSVVGDSPLGRKIVNRVREHGVDTGYVRWIPEGRVGLCYAEPGSAPRPTRLFYDTDESAFRLADPSEMPWSALEEARLLHIDLQTFDDHPHGARIIETAFSTARRAGCAVSVGMDNAPQRPPGKNSAGRLREWVGRADVALVTREIAETVFQGEGSCAQMAQSLRAQHPGVVFAVVDGAYVTPRAGTWTGAVAGDVLYEDESYAMEIIDSGGAFSAFAGGLSAGYLDGDLRSGLRYGNAAAALAHSIPGHLSWFTLQDIQARAQGQGAGLQR
jgi:2-dehydro-3-deoxygluconokinase